MFVAGVKKKLKTEAFVAEEAAEKWKKNKGVSTTAEGINEKKRCYKFTVDVAVKEAIFFVMKDGDRNLDRRVNNWL